MATDGKISLAVLAGDGIGPEITEATVHVLQAAAARTGLDVALTAYPIGWKVYEKSRSTLAPETVAALRSHAGWILGPTFAGEYPKGDPIKGHPSGYLRRNFALFANVRPVRAWPQLDPLIPDLDITILRENTEGFYPDRNLAWGYGEFMPTEEVGLSLRVITAQACDRFARFAFEYAATTNIDRCATAELVLPEDPDRGLSRDRAAARSRRQKCDRQRRLNPGSRWQCLDRGVCHRGDRRPRGRIKAAPGDRGAPCGRAHRLNLARPWGVRSWGWSAVLEGQGAFAVRAAGMYR